MKGNDEVIDLLNEVLTGELTAINQYFVHARMCENWGYQRLWKKVRDESIDEMKHADQLIKRILYLEGLPNLQRLGKVMVGQTVPEQLQLDLDMEKDAVARFNRGVALCVAKADNGTREMLEGMLVSEEEHVNWLEEQLNLISQLGTEHYLAQQVRE